ncbi:hypothetical protein BR63_05735 [Thermanaerosceptrum fracticalcis]|uniref:Phage replisome organiser N-terminal domain-containing protein n=1 Tax=Thermanaerosceptrum fracticalcis TaxID=1712410 RepID=A0A7G6E1A5_THEFR|nr:hypothetical protein [Thermanaerosceptrum fracticalcis]QNB45859.1 hypothetical protein BR63_05735 [Thermanaerosceptrum fracticalcis]
MPNRTIKESICTSENINNLTPEEEVFFYRLITKCDDFGRFDARPQVLRAMCFPWKVDQISIETIEKWLQSLVRENLIVLYTFEGKPYLEMVTWRDHQQVRATKSKYPGPDDEGSQLISIDINGNQEKAVVTDIRNRNRIRNRINTVQNDAYSPEFETFWSHYPRKVEKKGAYKCWNTRLKEGVSPEDMIMAAKNYAAECKRKNTEEQYIKHPKTFLGPNTPFMEYVPKDEQEDCGYGEPPAQRESSPPVKDEVIELWRRKQERLAREALENARADTS